MVIAAAASSFSLGPSHCHHSYTDDFTSSMPYKRHRSGRNRVFDACASANLSVLRCKIPVSGSAFHVSTGVHDLGLTKVSVAADYSDSVPDSSLYGYHPLEELKPCKRVRQTKLSPAEVARTTVEANTSAVLMFPGAIHCEPHGQNSWSEFKYVIDDYGDIFFKIPGDGNILEDPGASNPVKAFIGMDVPRYENTWLHEEYNISEMGNLDHIIFDEHYFEIMDSEARDIPVDWGMPDTSNGVHPIYFAKHMSKAISMDYEKKMDCPSNGVSILGCLRPAFLDEESYIRRLFLSEDRDDYSLEVQGDDNNTSTSSRHEENDMSSSGLYRLEIVGIELLSLYGTELRPNNNLPGSHPFYGEEASWNQSSSRISDIGRSVSATENPAEALHEIAIKCGTKVDYRPGLVASTDLRFSVEAWFSGKKVGEGIGKSRREALQKAAELSLQNLADIYLSVANGDAGPSHRDAIASPLANGNMIMGGNANTFDNLPFARDETAMAVPSRSMLPLHKRQGSPRSFAGMSNKRLKPDFQRSSMQRMPSSGRYS